VVIAKYRTATVFIKLLRAIQFPTWLEQNSTPHDFALEFPRVKSIVPPMFPCSVRVILICAALVLPCSARAQTTWLVNNTTNIGGYGVLKYGNPTVIVTPYGNAVLFNGVNQGLTVSNNPIAGWTNFTVEMIFRPDLTNVATAGAPRIFHIAAPNANQVAPDHRLTLEGRISNTVWYADTFLRYASAQASNNTLIDTSKTHPLGDWQQLAVTYDGTFFKQYVNTTFELSTNIASGGLTNGVASIGMRANTNNFFQGAVLALRFTPRVLATNEFLCVPRTRVDTFAVTNQTSVADFALTSGLPLGFTLQEAALPGGPWTNQTAATLTTNTPGVSYRFTTPATNNTRFYRVHWP
jgi:hypothetical protein